MIINVFVYIFTMLINNWGQLVADDTEFAELSH